MAETTGREEYRERLLHDLREHVREVQLICGSYAGGQSDETGARTAMEKVSGALADPEFARLLDDIDQEFERKPMPRWSD